MTITKVLAAEEDLLLGIGQAQQTRAGTFKTVTKVTPYKVVLNLQDLNYLDGDKYPVVQYFDVYQDIINTYIWSGTEYKRQNYVARADVEEILEEIAQQDDPFPQYAKKTSPDDEGAIILPSSTTDDRPTPQTGQRLIRFNTDTAVTETWNGTSWVVLATATNVDGAIILPAGPTSTRPDTAEALPYFRYNSDTNEYEAYFPGTDEWGELGGGGVPPFIYKDTGFIVQNKKAYAVDCTATGTTTVSVPTLGTGLPENGWFALAAYNTNARGEDYNTTYGDILVVSEVGNWEDPEVDSYRINGNTNATYYFQVVNGKIKVVDGIGESAESNANKLRIDELEQQVADLEDIVYSDSGTVELIWSGNASYSEAIDVPGGWSKYSKLVVYGQASETPGQLYSKSIEMSEFMSNRTNIVAASAPNSSNNYSFVGAVINSLGTVVTVAGASSGLTGGFLFRIEGVLK